ncbi:unnamed protein product [Rotaria sp. Silwood1]|nr:unnamed protein product [Rotaria sp. Silwood1]
MQAFIVVYALFISAYCVPIFDEQLNYQWSLFKRVHKKQYASINEEMIRRNIWEHNLAKIHQHNLEADLGTYSYTLGMNQFGDMRYNRTKKKLSKTIYCDFTYRTT